MAAKVAKRQPPNMELYLKELRQILSEKSAREIDGLLRDLLTPMEEKMLAKRVQIAKMLLTGKTYDEIETALNVQRSTISRIRAKLTLSPTRSLEYTTMKLPR